jgi:hypothetical protein
VTTNGAKAHPVNADVSAKRMMTDRLRRNRQRKRRWTSDISTRYTSSRTDTANMNP